MYYCFLSVVSTDCWKNTKQFLNVLTQSSHVWSDLKPTQTMNNEHWHNFSRSTHVKFRHILTRSILDLLILYTKHDIRICMTITIISDSKITIKNSAYKARRVWKLLHHLPNLILVMVWPLDVNTSHFWHCQLLSHSILTFNF